MLFPNSKQQKKAVLYLLDEFNENYLTNMLQNMPSMYGLEAVLLICQKDANERIQSILAHNPTHPLSTLTHVERYQDLWLEEILRKVQLLARSYDFQAVMTWEDQLVVESAFLSSMLNLPHPGIKAAITSRNKAAQRELLADTPWGISAKLYHYKDLATTPFPPQGILKPIDWSASKNVVAWQAPQPREKILQQITPEHEEQFYLLEDYIQGPEFSAEAWIAAGRITKLVLTQKGLFSTDESSLIFPVEASHYAPFLDPTIEAQVSDCIQFLINQLDIKDTALHLEFKLDATHTLRVMEWACRMGGGRIMNLHWIIAGFNPYAQSIATYLGKDVASPTTDAHPTRHALQYYFKIPPGFQFCSQKLARCAYYSQKHPAAHYPGYVLNLLGHGLSALPGIFLHELGVLKQESAVHEPILDGYGRHCFVVFSGPRQLELDAYKAPLKAFVYKTFLTPLATKKLPSEACEKGPKNDKKPCEEHAGSFSSAEHLA